MKKSFFILTAIAATATASFLFISCNSNVSPGNTTGEVVISKDSLIKRGSYLVNAMVVMIVIHPKK